MKNRKRFGKLALTAMAVAAAALLTGCGAKKEAQTLNLFTWDGMFPQEVLSGFEEEYNILSMMRKCLPSWRQRRAAIMIW